MCSCQGKIYVLLSNNLFTKFYFIMWKVYSCAHLVKPVDHIFKFRLSKPFNMKVLYPFAAELLAYSTIETNLICFGGSTGILGSNWVKWAIRKLQSW